MSEMEDRLMAQRARTDYKISALQPVLIMIDGRAFSRLVKKKYDLPFDSDFMGTMDTVAAGCCKEIQGCKFAYVQSDEISFYVDARPTEESTPSLYFDGRLCKIHSIVASTASGIFNRETLVKDLENGKISVSDIPERKLAQFDCKAWNVPEDYEVLNWFLLRQTDCIRNSKQQAAQTYLPHKRLMGLHTDEQTALLLFEKGISWDSYADGEKFGRFIWKEEVEMSTPDGELYTRSKWLSHPAWPLQTEQGREKLKSILGIL